MVKSVLASSSLIARPAMYLEILNPQSGVRHSYVASVCLSSVAPQFGQVHLRSGKGREMISSVVRAGFADGVFGEARDLAHEGGSVEFALFHLSELGFPVSGHRGRSERLDVHFLEKVNEAHALAGGDELAAVTGDVFLANETFDGRSAGGGCAESAFGHCFAELVVVDELSGSFHRGEESRLGVAGGRIGFLFLHRDLDGFGVFAFLDGAELVFASGDAGLATVDGEPAGSDEDFTVGAEGVLFGTVIDGGEALGDLELGMREEDGEEALHDHVVELGNGLVDSDNAAGRDDREVIGDLRIIEDTLLKLQAVVVEGVLGPVGEIGSGTGELGHDFLHVGHVVLGKVTRIGSRIGDHLVPLIKSLGEPEGILGGEGSLPLEGGEVVKLGRDLPRGFSVFGDDAGFVLATLGDDTGTFFIPDALGATVGICFVLLKVEVDPLAVVFAGVDTKESVDFGIRSRGESGDFLFALCEDGESGRLDASGGSDIKATVAGAETGQSAGGIEADEPVGFGAALSGVGKVGHFLAVAEFVPGLLDRAGGHGLHPEAFDGLLDLPVVHDVLEDELSLAAGITGIHDFGDVPELGELEDVAEASFGLFDGLEGEIAGDGREDVEFPRKVLSVGAGGHFELDEVTDRGGDHSLIVLEILGITGLSLLGKLAEFFREGFGEICSNRGLLSDDQSLGHGPDLGVKGGGWEEISFRWPSFRRKKIERKGVIHTTLTREIQVLIRNQTFFRCSWSLQLEWSFSPEMASRSSRRELFVDFFEHGWTWLRGKRPRWPLSLFLLVALAGEGEDEVS